MTSTRKGANTAGKAWVARGKYGDMELFDKLPKALRVALADSDHNWSAGHVTQLRRAKTRRILPCGTKVSFATTAEAVTAIKASDISQHTRDADAGLVCGGQR